MNSTSFVATQTVTSSTASTTPGPSLSRKCGFWLPNDLPEFIVDRTCHIHRSSPSINHHTAPPNTFIPGRHRNRLLHPIQQHPRPRQLIHPLRWLYSLLHRHHRRLLRRRAHNRFYRFRDTRPHGSFGKHAVEIPRRPDGFDLVASCHDERVYICHVEVPYF